MATTLTVKGQVTIPKHIRDALGLKPGHRVEFSVGDSGTVIIKRVRTPKTRGRDRFEAVRGIAAGKWRTDELMALIRG